MINITVNNKPHAVADNCSIDRLIETLELNSKGIAIAVNDTVVPRNTYSSHVLCDGDSVIIIKAFYGG
ncbi:MAG: sulfur carrier protein ThiS [Muribaculaceae bacterium]|nr:sulfur carrier protein ThiS [Muribaculaceae bacterium]